MLQPAFLKHQRIWRTTVIVVAVVIIMVHWVRAVQKPMDGDFKVHREFARRLVTGNFLYQDGMHTPYPVFWALFHIPALLLPLPLAKALLYPLGVGAMVALIALLHLLVKPHLPPRHGELFWIVTFTAFLASRYLLRDLAELGVNTFILLLSWLSVYLWIKHREWLAGASLGLATALKCTPAIFILFFVWKRQWKMVFVSLLFAGLFTLSPVLMQGSNGYSVHMGNWISSVWTGFFGKDPSVGTIGPEALQNMALRPTLARYLMHLPPDHPGRAQHPLYMDFLDLSAEAASVVIKIILGSIIVVALWWWRKPVLNRNDPLLLWEFAGVSLLLLLYSPLTWGQHCVSVVPACYLISSVVIVRGGLSRWMWGLVAGWILLVLVFNREVVGKSMHWLLQSYHLETFCIIALLAVVIGCWRQTAISLERAGQAVAQK